MGLEGLVGSDDDLKPLNWLQDRDLLKNVRSCRLLSELNENRSPVPAVVPPVAYDPRVHVHAKPPYSFSSLIFMAIESAPCKALPVKEIYCWIEDSFPFYRSAPCGWKNTIRHNLSLSKCFRKVEKQDDGSACFNVSSSFLILIPGSFCFPNCCYGDKCLPTNFLLPSLLCAMCLSRMGKDRSGPSIPASDRRCCSP